MSFLTFEAPAYRQRKISDFIGEMIPSEDSLETTAKAGKNKRTDKAAEKLEPKMMVKASSHDKVLYQNKD